MAEIKNPMAYFATMVRNSHKTEYRSNDNFYKHTSSVGDEHDIHDKLGGEKGVVMRHQRRGMFFLAFVLLQLNIQQLRPIKRSGRW